MNEENVKLVTVKVGANVLSLVSQVYLADTYKDGRLPAVYSQAPYFIVGGEGFYAVPADTESNRWIADSEADGVLVEDYTVEELRDPVEDSDIESVQRDLDRLGELRAEKASSLEYLEDSMDERLADLLGNKFDAYSEEKGVFEIEREDMLAEYALQVEALEKEIKERVIDMGLSIKADTMQAVFNSGRVSWNTKGLMGYALAHPQVRQFRKDGKEYVSLRTVNYQK